MAKGHPQSVSSIDNKSFGSASVYFLPSNNAKSGLRLPVIVTGFAEFGTELVHP